MVLSLSSGYDNELRVNVIAGNCLIGSRYGQVFYTQVIQTCSSST